MKHETKIRLDNWQKSYTKVKTDRHAFLELFHRHASQIIVPTLQEIEQYLRTQGQVATASYVPHAFKRPVMY